MLHLVKRQALVAVILDGRGKIAQSLVLLANTDTTALTIVNVRMETRVEDTTESAFVQKDGWVRDVQKVSILMA